MLQKMTLTDFQKYRSKEVTFDRITSFVGDTNAGKTTLLRALGLVCLNRWNECYLRHGQKTLHVKLEVDDQVIGRLKGTKNVYTVDGHKLTAFGKGNVPEEVDRLLNVDEDNFQWQLDPHFWFSDTSGNVAKKLNEIVNLEVIDSTTKNIADELRRAKNEVEVSESRMKEFEAKRDALAWAVEFSKDVDGLLEAQTRCKKSASRIASLRRYVRGVSRLARGVDNVSETILDAKKVIQYASRASVAAKRCRELGKLLKELESAIALTNAEIPDLSELTDSKKVTERAYERRVELESLIQELKEVEDEVCKLNADIKEQAGNQPPGRCPVCGRRTTTTSRRKSSRSSAPTSTSGGKPR